MLWVILAIASVSSAFQIRQVELPTEFSWDNVNNTNFMPTVRNQLFPAPCNSGWAMAATTVIDSRIKIMRKAEWPDIQIAPQVLIDCDGDDYGCYGVSSMDIQGDPYTAYSWISRNKITD